VRAVRYNCAVYKARTRMKNAFIAYLYVVFAALSAPLMQIAIFLLISAWQRASRRRGFFCCQGAVLGQRPLCNGHVQRRNSAIKYALSGARGTAFNETNNKFQEAWLQLSASTSSFNCMSLHTGKP